MGDAPRAVNFRDAVAVIAFACVALVAARARAAEAEPYMVVPFANKSPVKSLDWMTSAIAITIAEKMESVSSLRPVYGLTVLDGVDPQMDEGAIARRARERGAKWVFTGSFSRPNWKSEVTVRLHAVIPPSETIDAPSLRMVAESSSVAESKELFDQIDGNLVAVLQKAGWQLEPEELAQVRRRPTKDLYAFTVYGRALNLFYGFGVAKNLPESVKLFKKVNLIDPKFAESHRALGRVHLELGENQRAASQYAYALDLRPGYYAALVGLMRLFRQEGNRARCKELAERAIEQRPYDLEVRALYGELLWEEGDLDRAQSELERVVTASPHMLSARRALVLVYAAKGATQDLAAELERVEELAPEDIDVKLDLGSAYQRMGDIPKAIGAYEDVLKKQPRNVQALKFVGDCYRRNNEPERAIAAYQKVQRISPEDPRPYFLLGAAYAEAGHDAKAEQAFLDAQQFKRYLGEAWTNLGAIAFRRGDLSRAFWYLSRAVVKSPSRPKAHYNYAMVLSAKKERDKALDELRIAADLDPKDADIRYLAGVILLRQGRLDEAKRMFQEALKRKPDHADAKHNLAMLEELERRYGSEKSATGAQ